MDIHVHGGNGIEIMDDDPEAVFALAQFYASHGVTGFLPTTWTAGDDPIYHALKRVADAQQRQATETIGAHIWGAHVEGPYVNPTKAGAQNPHLIRRANPAEFLRWQSTGVIKLMTIAPEFEENLSLIRHCTAHDIITSAGHTDATQADMIAGMKAGISNTTHTFN
ncbi:MAG: amidohydrolase family protein, partial [Anaerolineae bacterium]|nr:amidohydrolase family protein [Anaerolineae bacterium]